MSVQTIVLKGVKTFFTIKPKRNPNISKRRAVYGAIAVAATQATDYTSTFIGIHFAGATESNGIMADVINNYGFLGFLGIKVLGAVFLAWYTYQRRYAPWVVAGIYAAVTLWNSTVIAQGLLAS